MKEIDGPGHWEANGGEPENVIARAAAIREMLENLLPEDLVILTEELKKYLERRQEGTDQ